MFWLISRTGNRREWNTVREISFSGLPSNNSNIGRILVRVRRMYAANHGITLRAVSDELSSRGQDRCRHMAEGSQPPKATGIVVVRHRGSWHPKERYDPWPTYIPQMASRSAHALLRPDRIHPISICLRTWVRFISVRLREVIIKVTEIIKYNKINRMIR